MSGQVGHARPAASSLVVPGIAVLLAAVLLAGIALAALRSDTANAETELVEGSGVTATLADGSAVDLEVGDEVPPGATLLAGGDTVVLRTRDRDVLLASGSRLTVVDGARQVLRAGLLMVDARRGPGVTVETAAADVHTPDGAVSRIEPGALLRVGAFSGDALDVRPAGRSAHAEVEALHQVQVPVGGLPAQPTPLALTGDAYEQRVAATLLSDDRVLNDLGRTFDSAGDQGPAVLAALSSALPLVAGADPDVRAAASSPGAALTPAAAPRSEPALAFLLAAAPSASGDADTPLAYGGAPLGARYTEVRDLRAAGGSWAVVARLVDAPVTSVGSLLDRLLSPLVLLAGGAPAPADLVGLLVPPLPVPGGGGSSSLAGGGAAPGSPGGGPTPPPSDPDPEDPPPDDEDPIPVPTPPPPPVPPPAEGPVGTVITTVEVVVETVLGLLPDPPVPAPAPAPSPAQVPTAPAPAPEPSLLSRLLDPVLPG